ncbi:MAG TPA: hypothetical protein VFZ69_07745 [Longimicrobiales bacterium]
MKHAVLRKTGPLVAVLLAIGCTDPVSTPDAPGATRVDVTLGAVLACDLTSSMTADVRDYFTQPERRTAQDVMRLLSSACSAGDATLTTQYAVQLLTMIETALEAGRGGSATVGSRLVNALLACTTAEGCSSAGLPVPALNLVGAMSTGGLFSLHTGASGVPAIARDAIPFTDFSGNANSALFGTELTAGNSWTAVNGGTHLVLIYGSPVAGAGQQGFASLRYDLERWPDTGNFIADGLVHVGVCFAQEVVLPHDPVTGKSDQARMRRESTLLSNYSPTFCPPVVQNASVLASLTAFAKTVLRSTGFMILGDTRTPIVGGSPIGWSQFGPEAANVEGRLVMETEPAAVTNVGESFGPITIQALSGDGTPMERVLVTLYIFNNSGTPAGAVLTGTVSGYTSEIDGRVVIDGNSIDKAGGYTICARGELTGFTFEEDCSSGVFHMRNK